MNNLLNKIFSQIGKPVASVVILVLLSFSFVNAAEDGFPPGRATAEGGNGGGILGESKNGATEGTSTEIGLTNIPVCANCKSEVSIGENTTPRPGNTKTNGTQGVKSGN